MPVGCWESVAGALSPLSQRQGGESESVQVFQIFQKALQKQPLASCKCLNAEIGSWMILNGIFIY